MSGRKLASPNSKVTKQVNGIHKPLETRPKKQPGKAAAVVPEMEVSKPAKTNKRKAENEVEKPVVNGTTTKRQRSIEPPTMSPPSRKTGAVKRPKTQATTKQTAAKKPKRTGAKAVINHAPTELLSVYVFGDGASGELGLGSAKGQLEVKRPRLNPLLAADSVGVVQLAVGGMHTAALTHDNKILTWGVNDQGALGRDTTWDGGLRDMDEAENSDDDSDSGSESAVNPHESSPKEVDVTMLSKDTIFTQVACSDSATFALTEEGLVYGWGTFRVGQTLLQV